MRRFHDRIGGVDIQSRCTNFCCPVYLVSEAATARAPKFRYAHAVVCSPTTDHARNLCASLDTERRQAYNGLIRSPDPNLCTVLGLCSRVGLMKST